MKSKRLSMQRFISNRLLPINNQRLHPTNNIRQRHTGSQLITLIRSLPQPKSSHRQQPIRNRQRQQQQLIGNLQQQLLIRNLQRQLHITNHPRRPTRSLPRDIRRPTSSLLRDIQRPTTLHLMGFTIQTISTDGIIA